MLITVSAGFIGMLSYLAKAPADESLKAIGFHSVRSPPNA